ncbi:MAG: Sjogren's syndrome/scleroderma autoantigen 1 family protein [Candidatus Verstraetearchaeota archaeon]|nr:Sjogren's syndrome/scleroderma autoantigen 1 family protein [Candidatus Verstraetearchaeota archaeon]
MADLLREGAAMLSQICPDCKTPLFRLSGGEVICPGCNRRVVFAKSTDTERVATQAAVASSLEAVIMNKISDIRSCLESTTDLLALEKQIRVLSALFDLLEKVRKTKL